MTPLPEDVETLKAMLLAERSARRTAEAQAHERALQIEKLKHTIAKLRHERFGQSAERRTLLDQLELQLVELEEDQAQSETVAETVVETATVQPFQRRKPVRRPLPDHLPRERVVYPVPPACPCCGGGLRNLGEDVTETLELVPRQWKVIQHVREKYSCRACETITHPPAPERRRLGAKQQTHGSAHAVSLPAQIARRGPTIRAGHVARAHRVGDPTAAQRWR
jgi:transposase